MAKHLVVSRDFASYVRGEHITDPAEVAKVLASNPTFVRAIAVPDAPAAAPAAEPAKAA